MDRRAFLNTAAASVTLTSFGQQGHTRVFEKRRATVLGQQMAYVDEGSGRPVVFLHGNPVSSYLWRNIIPYVSGTHRAIAPDLMGMGDSDKVAMTRTYVESAQYLHTFLDSLDLRDAVLVIHDWGSSLGWHYARTRPERISAIAFIEAMVPPLLPIPSFEALGPFGEFLRTVRTPGLGEDLILDQNYFLDQLLAHGSPNGSLPAEVMAEYKRYFPTPESRQILLGWPREVPIAGDPADVSAIVDANSAWLIETEFPKLMFHVEPGGIIPMQVAQALKGMLTNLDAVFLGRGGHFPQEHHPDAIGRGLAEWLTRL